MGKDSQKRQFGAVKASKSGPVSILVKNRAVLGKRAALHESRRIRLKLPDGEVVTAEVVDDRNDDKTAIVAHRRRFSHPFTRGLIKRGYKYEGCVTLDPNKVLDAWDTLTDRPDKSLVGEVPANLHKAAKSVAARKLANQQ